MVSIFQCTLYVRACRYLPSVCTVFLLLINFSFFYVSLHRVSATKDRIRSHEAATLYVFPPDPPRGGGGNCTCIAIMTRTKFFPEWIHLSVVPGQPHLSRRRDPEAAGEFTLKFSDRCGVGDRSPYRRRIKKKNKKKKRFFFKKNGPKKSSKQGTIHPDFR